MKQQQDCSREQEDASLVADTLTGNQDAFALLFQRHAPSVQRLCTRLLGTTVEAQDIVQEAALQAFLGLSRLREPARFAAWFHAIAANLARSALRRQRESFLQAPERAIMTDFAWSHSSPTLEESLFEREMQVVIVQACQELAPAHRQAIIGFYLQGYHYEELAEQLGIPVSTLKWRLFEGRKLLRTHLQPLAEELLYSVESQTRKEKPVKLGDTVTLQMDSLRHIPFTGHYQAILRDPASGRMLPLSLTEAEFHELEVTLHVRQDPDAPLVPQDLSQRLLESLGAHLQQVVINTLVGQILYATATLKQGAHVRSVDMRLSEALVLAIREGVPITITRSLFETTMALALPQPANPPSEQHQPMRGKAARKLGREERLQWEEALHQQHLIARRSRPKQLWERLWAMLLVSLTNLPDAPSAAELGTVDLAALFSPHTATWDAQPVIALQLPAQEEASWLLIPPAVWEQLMQEWQALHVPDQSHESGDVTTHPLPETLAPLLQQQVEELLVPLVDLPTVRTAVLLNPAGTVTAWRSPETRESLQDFCDARNDLCGPLRAQDRESGDQKRKKSTIFYVKPRTQEQEAPNVPEMGRFLASHRSGWRLAVFFEEPRVDQGKESLHRRLEEIWQAILRLLTQNEPE